MRYWLLKTEPGTYSWDDLVRDGETDWTGVRNFQARNNIRAMAKGDLAFVYHSGDQKAIVGVAKIASAPHPDPTAKEGDWNSVNVAKGKPLGPVTLGDVKAAAKKHAALRTMVLINNSRLSVQPVTEEEWRIISAL